MIFFKQNLETNSVLNILEIVIYVCIYVIIGFVAIFLSNFEVWNSTILPCCNIFTVMMLKIMLKFRVSDSPSLFCLYIGSLEMAFAFSGVSGLSWPFCQLETQKQHIYMTKRAKHTICRSKRMICLFSIKRGNG